MLKKLLILTLCGLVRPSFCSIVKCRSFQEPLYRSDLLYRFDPTMRPESFYKRESIYPREPNNENAAIVPQRSQMVRNEPVYEMRLVPHILIPQQPMLHMQPLERGIQSVMANGGEIQNENVTPNEHIIRPEPFIKRENIIPAVVQTPIQSTVQILREGPNFRNNPDVYFPLNSCPRIHLRRHAMPKIKPVDQQNVYYPVHSQMPQHFQQIPPRIGYENPVVNSQVFRPVTAVPRVQHFVAQNPPNSLENVQFSSGSTQNNQENSNYGNDSLQYQNNANNFQSPSSPVNEELQEDMSPAVTARTVSSVSNHIPLNQISSIC